MRPGNDLLRSIGDRLVSIEAVLVCYGTGVPVDQGTAQRVTRLALLGTSRLRHTLRNSNYPREYREQMGAVVALVEAGRIAISSNKGKPEGEPRVTVANVRKHNSPLDRTRLLVGSLSHQQLRMFQGAPKEGWPSAEIDS
ncbi:hypothetical protein [Tunturiibacter gelidiferens]|uniref:Uncharacterized protein n=1 Tax=Tunturiibacter gelidiferens TaxID=3069689 RepID=A0AAU7YVC1_9BACT